MQKTQHLCCAFRQRITIRCWGQYLPCMGIQKLPITEQGLHVTEESPEDPTSIPEKAAIWACSQAPALQALKCTVWNVFKKIKARTQNIKPKKAGQDKETQFHRIILKYPWKCRNKGEAQTWNKVLISHQFSRPLQWQKIKLDKSRQFYHGRKKKHKEKPTCLRKRHTPTC